jgi:hypothetical protein
MGYDTTMLDLVTALTRQTSSEAEVVATVIWLVNSGAVRLCGTFKGLRFGPGIASAPRRQLGGRNMSTTPT